MLRLASLPSSAPGSSAVSAGSGMPAEPLPTRPASEREACAGVTGSATARCATLRPILGGEPGVEVDLPDAGVRACGQLAAVQLRAEIERVRVGDDGPRVTRRGEQSPRPGVDPERLGAADLHPAGRRA